MDAKLDWEVEGAAGTVDMLIMEKGHQQVGAPTCTQIPYTAHEARGNRPIN